MILLGSRLLSGGDTVQLWEAPPHPDTHQAAQPSNVEFFIAGDDGGGGGSEGTTAAGEQWRCIWNCRPATPVSQVQFSPDGLLFATVGKVRMIVHLISWVKEGLWF